MDPYSEQPRSYVCVAYSRWLRRDFFVVFRTMAQTYSHLYNTMISLINKYVHFMFLDCELNCPIQNGIQSEAPCMGWEGFKLTMY